LQVNINTFTMILTHTSNISIKVCKTLHS